MDFLGGQQLIFTSERFENIYKHLKESYEIKYHDLFILCAAIGFKNNQPIDFQKHGREFRSNYLNPQQKATAYSIILADKEIGRNIDKFDDSEFIYKARIKLQKYAEGGMQILCDEVFSDNFIDNYLNTSYREYDIDIFAYVLEKLDAIPF